MGKVIRFKGRDDVIEYDSCNLYCFSPVKASDKSLNCVILYDINNDFYRLNIFNSEDQNLFTNLFIDIGLSFLELIKILNIYEIDIGNEIKEKIKNEPTSIERKKRYDYIISNTEFL